MVQVWDKIIFVPNIICTPYNNIKISLNFLAWSWIIKVYWFIALPSFLFSIKKKKKRTDFWKKTFLKTIDDNVTSVSGENVDGSDFMPDQNGMGGDSESPVFLKQPSDSYVIKTRPATLHCRVARATDIHFQCNSEIVKPTKRVDHVEPESGDRYTEASVEISRSQVEEYFGEFHCACVAVSPKGSVMSRHALVTFACKFYIAFTYNTIFCNIIKALS